MATFLHINTEDIVEYEYENITGDSGKIYHTLSMTLENGDTVCMLFNNMKRYIKSCNILEGLVK